MLLTGGDPEVTTSVLETVMDAASSAISFSGSVLTTMISNPIYAFFFGAGLVGVGLALVRALKRTARS